MQNPSETPDLFADMLPHAEVVSEGKKEATPPSSSIDASAEIDGVVVGDEEHKSYYWADNLRQVPNALIRCGLFTVGNNKQERKVWRAAHPALIESYGSMSVNYFGEELRQDDLDVLLEMLQVARGQNVEDALHIRPIHFINDMNWSKNSASYERLRTCIKRLQGGVMTIIVYLNKERTETLTYNGSLIVDSYLYENEDKRVNDRWKVSLNPKLMKFFDVNAFTRINWFHRMEISSPLGKFLHSFFASHNGNFPIHWRKIMMISGYRAKSASAERKFKSDVLKYLGKMKQIGAILDFEIDENDCLKVKPVKWKMLNTQEDAAHQAAKKD